MTDMEQAIDEECMKCFVLFVSSCSQKEIGDKRVEIFEQINGDIFYPINSWPIEFRLIFWKKPLSDKNTFKLILFLVGNGCSPWITYERILTSTYWDRSKTTKRWEQIRWINANMEKHKNNWFYFDMFHKIHLYFNGNERKL